MARSTWLASLAVAVLVASLGTLAARRVTREVVLPELPPMFKLIEIIDATARVPEIRWTPPAAPPADPRGLPVPVPDVVAPPADLADPLLPAGPVGEEHEGPPASLPHSGGAGTADDPLPSTYQYVDEPPAEVHCAEARYPDLAREAGVEGTVKLLILVGVDGHARRAIVQTGGSVPLLDEAALAAARSCVFTPALMNGHPVKVWVAKHYHFSLH